MAPMSNTPQTGPGGLPDWLADLAPKEPRVAAGTFLAFLQGCWDGSGLGFRVQGLGFRV